MEAIKRFIKDEEGQNMIEYGLIVALVSIAAITAITLMRTQIIALYTAITAAITAAVAGI